jgi:hypothetical protein
MLLDESNEIGLNNCLARQGLDEGGDGLSEAFVGDANDRRICHRWVQLEGFFDFLGVHLFAASVDALTAAT